MKFCDYAKIFLKSGGGGNGCVSFRREKNIPFGGPDGGRGGNGGNVMITCTHERITLIDFRYKPHYKAENGHPGAGRNKAGLAGKDVVLKVPLGTEVWSEGVLIADLTHSGETITLLRGGLGGAGNLSFSSSTNRTPREYRPGTEGESMEVELRLKVLADVGFIGLPNAGKSTLLAALTHATPKIAPYPFSTLTPQLGTFVTPLYNTLVIADLPGLVEGAHHGKGLGHRFLGHGERCRFIFHVLDGTDENIAQNYAMICEELRCYSPDFLNKTHTVIITKKDHMTPEQCVQCTALFPQAILVSAVTGENMNKINMLLSEWCDEPLSVRAHH